MTHRIWPTGTLAKVRFGTKQTYRNAASLSCSVRSRQRFGRPFAAGRSLRMLHDRTPLSRRSTIRDLVFKLAESTNSLDHAYAVTIAGFSDQRIEVTELIQRHVNNVGLSGDAAKVAQVSHLDAEWAEKWVGEMWDAKTAEEFWRCLTIAKTCMDARVSNEPKAGTLWTQYAPVFHRARKAAMKDRSKERAKRLIGQDVPDAVFISA